MERRIGMQGIPAYGEASPFQARWVKKGKSAEGFGSQMNQAANVRPKVYQVYLKTDDMLYSGGNGSGLSFYLKYAEGSTEEEPTMVAKGVDENGNEFEQTIHINRINPRCATAVEMRALEAYLGVEKDGGLTSLPKDPTAGNMGLYERRDFISMFQRQIRDMQTLGQRKMAAYYQYSMKMYQDFMLKRKESGFDGAENNGLSALLAYTTNPLQQRMQQVDAMADDATAEMDAAGAGAETAAANETEAEEEARVDEESKSDSEIITKEDGSKILLITQQIGGTKVVTSVELSKPSPLMKEQETPVSEDGLDLLFKQDAEPAAWERSFEQIGKNAHESGKGSAI